MSTSSSKQQREQKESPSQGHNVLAGRSTLLSSPSPPTKATTILKKMTETKFEVKVLYFIQFFSLSLMGLF